MKVVFLCVGKDLNLRSPKATDLQSVVIDHSTTDAYSIAHIHSIHNSQFLSIVQIYCYNHRVHIRMKKAQNKPLSYIELSQKSLQHNLKILRSVANKGTLFIFAVKGNAYGHGQNEITKMSEKLVDFFMVNSLEELRRLRAISQKPTFVLGYVSSASLTEAMQLGCIMGVFSLEQLDRKSVV